MKKETEELLNRKDSTVQSTSMNEKMQELELLLKSKDCKIQFLEDEHKKEVLRAAKAEDVNKTYRSDILNAII